MAKCHFMLSVDGGSLAIVEANRQFAGVGSRIHGKKRVSYVAYDSALNLILLRCTGWS